MKPIRSSPLNVPFGLLVSAAATFGLSMTLAAAPVGAVPGRLLVKPNANTAEEQLTSEYDLHGALELGRIDAIGLRILKVPDEALERVLHAWSHNPKFDYVEPDIALPPDAVPNDPYFGNQWHLAKIGATIAWDTTLGDESLVIAVLDSGVEATHPDLSSKMVAGWNVYDNNSNTADVHGHGTAVAGAAAAAFNNGTGVASVAAGCRIMPVRISDANAYAYWSTVASGLTWAADHGARVANISYAASSSSSVASAAQYFQSKGGVVTISAGNDGATLADADNPYALTVSATTQSDTLTTWSNRGNLIDVSAPGIDIATTMRGGGYGYWWGTSFSAPIVAGAAALVISANPTLSGAQVQEIIKQSADDLGAVGWDGNYGWGRVNAARAVEMAIAAGIAPDTTVPTVSFTSPANNALLQGTITINVTANDNIGVTRVVISVNGQYVAESSAAPFAFSWDTTASADGKYTLSATAHDAAGNTSTSSVTVTVMNTIDTIAPNVVITSPKAGATVRNNVSVSVNASDNIGIAKVELYVDGKLASMSTVAPYTTQWNAKTATKGSHTLQCKAYDLAGNSTLSSPISVTK